MFPTKTRVANTGWINAAVKRAGIDESIGKVTLHTLWHTFATRLLSGGLNIVECQSLLGHRNIASTMVYQHVQAEAASAKAASILDNF